MCPPSFFTLRSFSYKCRIPFYICQSYLTFFPHSIVLHFSSVLLLIMIYDLIGSFIIYSMVLDVCSGKRLRINILLSNAECSYYLIIRFGPVKSVLYDFSVINFIIITVTISLAKASTTCLNINCIHL